MRTAMSRDHQKRWHRRIPRGKHVTDFERQQAAHAMSEQRILNSGLSGDSLGDQVGERVDSIRQRLADPAAVSRIFDAPHVNAGRQQITPRAKDTGGSSSVGQTVKPQMRARFVAAQAHKRSGACPCPRPNSIIGLFQHCISNQIADSTHVHHSIASGSFVRIVGV
jgi:hypothetical protein